MPCPVPMYVCDLPCSVLMVTAPPETAEQARGTRNTTVMKFLDMLLGAGDSLIHLHSLGSQHSEMFTATLGRCNCPPPTPTENRAGASGARQVQNWSFAGQGLCRAVVCLSVCLLRGELVRGGWSDRDETFGGGRWQCRERLSPEPARLVEVRPKKGREI